MKIYLTVGFFLLLTVTAWSQDQKSVVQVNDSLPVINLNEINIVSHRGLFSFWERWRMRRLIYNVRKVYPYAKTAGQLLKKYSNELKQAKNDAQRRKLMRKAEKELKEKYSDRLMQLNFTQGIILIKLIDRETGSSSYDLVSDLRGKFLAFFYQGVARLWGYNLKTKYDPKNEDKKIEKIVLLINQGKL